MCKDASRLLTARLEALHVVPAQLEPNGLKEIEGFDLTEGGVPKARTWVEKNHQTAARWKRRRPPLPR